MSAPLDVHRYLDRLGAGAAPSPSARALADLQRLHLSAVPFENLDIHRGVALVLSPSALFDKIVVRRRGGFCYELNGLFALLLEALGFDVQRLSARVYGDDGALGPPHDHLALRVRCEGDWLVDVGFGAAFVEPLDLAATDVQHQDRGAYRIARGGGLLTYSERDDAGALRDQYVFDLTPYPLAAFEAMCRYHQSAPESPFTQKRVCTRLTADGRITLRDRELISTLRGERTSTPIDGAAAWLDALRAHFGIELE